MIGLESEEYCAAEVSTAISLKGKNTMLSAHKSHSKQKFMHGRLTGTNVRLALREGLTPNKFRHSWGSLP